MPLKVKKAGAWVDPSAIYAKVAGAWVALTTPVADPAISFVTSIVGSTLASGVTSVTFTGHQVGDLLIAFGGNSGPSTPSTITAGTGWTIVASAGVTANQFRNTVVAVKRATSTANDTVQFTGGTTTSSARYSGGIVFRGVKYVGARSPSGVNGAASTTCTFKALTPFVADGTSAMVVVSYLGGSADGITSAPAGWTVTNGMMYRLAQSALAGGNASFPANAFNISVALELVN